MQIVATVLVVIIVGEAVTLAVGGGPVQHIGPEQWNHLLNPLCMMMMTQVHSPHHHEPGGGRVAAVQGPHNVPGLAFTPSPVQRQVRAMSRQEGHGSGGQYNIVKLREREGHRVDLGRLLKGHL